MNSQHYCITGCDFVLDILYNVYSKLFPHAVKCRYFSKTMLFSPVNLLNYD
jgi:hypothetical protein